MRKELVRPEPGTLGGRTYRFRHLLIRDAAYDAIPKAARAELHERFGRWLEERPEGARPSTRRSSATTSSRRTAIAPSSGPVDGAAQALAREAARRLGSRPATGRSPAATLTPP